MGLALTIAVLVVIIGTGLGGTAGAAVWTHRRVRAEYSQNIAVLAAIASGLATFMGGWMIFVPAWLAGVIRRKTAAVPRPRRTGKFVMWSLAFGSAGLALLGIPFAVSGKTEAAHEHALRVRGETTLGRVESVSYDGGGGDPGGWTSIHVAFTDAAGASQVTTIGHHYEPTERAGDPVEVLYDPLHPSVAEYAKKPFDGSDAAGVWPGIGLFAVAGGLAAMFAVFARRCHAGGTEPPLASSPIFG